MSLFAKSVPYVSATVARLTNAIPVPTSIYGASVGVALSRSAVHVAGIVPGKHLPEVRFLDKTPIPSGSFDDVGGIQNHALLCDVLQRAREQHAIARAHISLPEEHAYVFRVSLPRESLTDVSQAVEFHLKENVPFTIDQVVFDYEVVAMQQDAIDVQVVVYPLAVATEYYTLFEEAGYVMAGAELHGKAIARACLDAQHPMTSIILLDDGPATVVTVRNGVVRASVTLDVPGDIFFTEPARVWQLSRTDTEMMLRTVGVTNDNEERASFLRDVAEKCVTAVVEKIAYWNIQALGPHAEERPVCVQVAGKYAGVRGFAEYVSARIEMPVRLAHTWKRVSFRKYFPVSRTESLGYATAVGLALRDFS